MKSIGITGSKVTKVTSGQLELRDDLVVIEEPLEILVGYGLEHDRKEFPLTVTMRTPGSDEDLTLGFLCSEGIITHPNDYISVYHCQTSEHPENTMRVELNYDTKFNPDLFRRNFLANSSCGVCGQAVMEHVEKKINVHVKKQLADIDHRILLQLSKQVDDHQTNFRHTGGIHAAGMFDRDGKLLMIREDIGRHNALDKIIGAMLKEQIDPADKILWLSSRIGFELVQKALMAGLNNVVALGAPSNLAVQLAIENQLFLVGFLGKNTYNIYAGVQNDLNQSKL